MFYIRRRARRGRGRFFLRAWAGSTGSLCGQEHFERDAGGVEGLRQRDEAGVAERWLSTGKRVVPPAGIEQHRRFLRARRTVLGAIFGQRGPQAAHTETRRRFACEESRVFAVNEPRLMCVTAQTTELQSSRISTGAWMSLFGPAPEVPGALVCHISNQHPPTVVVFPQCRPGNGERPRYRAVAFREYGPCHFAGTAKIACLH